ncbi:MAG: riboflavin synthase subunit alpha [Gammaproteobacteria bacterium]|nr:MAG: riboflavin synthase subunit alpha [Gammaproteobacteria bacterium]TND07350.1 MAG: riboflavin synthase subunit alpha [Gammaproteobacteria bacterium]
MFSGIVAAMGMVANVTPADAARRLYIDAPDLDLAGVSIGDSVSVSGVCLTVIDIAGDRFGADVSNETLSCTTLGDLAPGVAVNLEKALLPTTRLGGHLVSGHVDGVGTVIECALDGDSVRVRVRVPDELARYIAAKGSVCVDGVSLTVNRVDGAEFELNIVPHTRQVTTLGEYAVGRPVNIEVDVIARYLERLVAGDRAANPAARGVTLELLRNTGFIE